MTARRLYGAAAVLLSVAALASVAVAAGRSQARVLEVAISNRGNYPHGPFAGSLFQEFRVSRGPVHRIDVRFDALSKPQGEGPHAAVRVVSADGRVQRESAATVKAGPEGEWVTFAISPPLDTRGERWVLELVNLGGFEGDLFPVVARLDQYPGFGLSASIGDISDDADLRVRIFSLAPWRRWAWAVARSNPLTTLGAAATLGLAIAAVARLVARGPGPPPAMRVAGLLAGVTAAGGAALAVSQTFTPWGN